MKSYNWLYNYKKLSGIENSFAGVARRANYLDSSSAVFNLFEKHYDALQNCYKAFFPFVKAFSKSEIEQFLN
jgi:acyl carrier protein phosphodiesterase